MSSEPPGGRRTGRPPHLQSLLGTGPAEGEVREGHPEGEEWRADALARSRHTRWQEELRPPSEDYDEERSATVCADIARALLGDFAPALLLLPAGERRRAQALLAYASTLFDFARQPGVEGERLAQINRWEFTLEESLSNQPVGQPVFVRMARENRRRAWPVDALDDLAACARRRAVRPRPATVAEAELDALALARAAASALLEENLTAEIDSLASALVRLWGLQNLGAEIRRHRNPVPVSEVEEDPEGRPDPAALAAAVRRECALLRPRLLRAPRGLGDLPTGYRRASVFALLAALRLLTEIEDADTGLLKAPPRLGLGARIAFLLRARWVGR